MEVDCCVYLGDPSYAHEPPDQWRDMVVRSVEGAEWLITGHAFGRAHAAQTIAAELCDIWDRQLRYSYRSARTVIASAESIALHGITQIDPGEFWVSVKIEVSLTQRRWSGVRRVRPRQNPVVTL